MKTIQLTQGLTASISDEDFELVSKYKWFAVKSSFTYYARTNIYINGRRQSIGMHRLILGVTSPLQADHRDHCGTNNQRSNLRLCTSHQNQFNRSKRPESPYKGICPRNNKTGVVYLAVVKYNLKRHYAGTYKRIEDAAAAYDRKASELFGEFASLNFPERLLCAI